MVVGEAYLVLGLILRVEVKQFVLGECEGNCLAKAIPLQSVVAITERIVWLYLTIDCEILASFWISLRTKVESRKAAAGLEALKMAVGGIANAIPQVADVDVCQGRHGLQLKLSVGGEGCPVDGYQAVCVLSKSVEHDLWNNI